ncbi:MAG: hypothetical protein RI894_1714 [Bacteroidota bacterium]|jgi:hypothetical protein
MKRLFILLRKFWWFPAIIFANLTLAVMYPPDWAIFRAFAGHAVYIMFAFFALAIGFLMLQQTRLMVTSFLCCATLCLHLQQSAGSQEFRYGYTQPNNERRLRIVHFSTTNTDGDYTRNIKEIVAAKPDIISVQEVTPDWDDALQTLLEKDYPNSRSFKRIDNYGIAIFSKYPLNRIDTFETNHVPNIIGSIRVDSLYPDVFFVASQTVPALTANSYETIRHHLSCIAARVKNINAPIITFGNYYCVPWSSEIQSFRDDTNLSDGHRYFSPDAPSPTDFIFFSHHFNCLSFEPLKDKNKEVIGIWGDYQFKTRTPLK